MTDTIMKDVRSPAYTVHESWEQDPVNPTDGAWVYTVVHTTEGVIKEHRWYAAAERHANKLNARQSVAS